MRDVSNLKGTLYISFYPPLFQIYQLELTRLEFLDFWMRSIYTFTAGGGGGKGTHNTTQKAEQEEADNLEQLSPPIFIVGTHKNSLGSTLRERKQMVSRVPILKRSS